MNQARLMQVLLAPHNSEKANLVGEKHRQYVFKVLKDSTKLEVKQAVELLFNVKVESVQIVNVKGKQKTFGRIRGKRANWKKSYVRLEEGFDIVFVN
ncbi:MAG: 50S ribosomal protein L23 [Beggiatoa sp. IS2]|nr:MAG: 50S ribosomal protein L23 [Beggiatoa sp. IS2]